MKIYDYYCFIDDKDRVFRSLSKDNLPVYPYKKDKEYGGWTICKPKPATLRAGLKNGTYIMK